ncbi:HAD-like domain [Pseudocohnilembus persalinus]|uniref:5'-nucleotidase n=1 Tax=Pseudocohnilembus persalinus TaxID=266149 RepID=A0A0V0QRD3_PSEPJ|nr:HAD-like domain [Pseudocohnilembus persalinus]|eukprot:KRX04806.1 HAD-like domain [Pseudocohnilembus persalinus]
MQLFQNLNKLKNFSKFLKSSQKIEVCYFSTLRGSGEKESFSNNDDRNSYQGRGDNNNYKNNYNNNNNRGFNKNNDRYQRSNQRGQQNYNQQSVFAQYDKPKNILTQAYKIATENHEEQIFIRDEQNLQEKIDIFSENTMYEKEQIQENEENDEIQQQQLQKQNQQVQFDIVSPFEGSITLQFENNPFSLFMNSDKISVEFKQNYHRIMKESLLFQNDKMLHYTRKEGIQREFQYQLHALLEKENITLKQFQEIVQEEDIYLRNKYDEFLDLVFDNQVPYYIISQGAKDLIENSFKSKKVQNFFEFKRNNIISNQLLWQQGQLKGFNNRSIVHQNNLYQKLLNKKQKGLLNLNNNAIIIGSNTKDISNYDQVYNNIISIGFGSSIEHPKEFDLMKEKFDIVIDNFGTYVQINKIVQEILEKSKSQE